MTGFFHRAALSFIYRARYQRRAGNTDGADQSINRATVMARLAMATDAHNALRRREIEEVKA